MKARDIADTVRRRIIGGEWPQGSRIPDEAELALSFGAARATVNKALQVLADEGLLDRRRRAGTRVAVAPARKAVLSIPIVREQIESAGMVYAHRVIAQRRAEAPAELAGPGVVMIHQRAVHYGDGRAWQVETRWLNPAALPALEGVDFRAMSANEWLVRHAPPLRAELRIAAEQARAREARLLGTARGEALLILHRQTWNEAGLITSVRIACHPGFALIAQS